MQQPSKKLVKYTYLTEQERMEKIKILAVRENKPVNKLIDEILDAYITISE